MNRVAALSTLLLALLATGCDSRKACPEHAECEDKASECLCDKAGHLVEQRGDFNGDGKADKMTFQRDERGLVTVKETDYKSDDTVDRHEQFVYDEQGRRTSNSGFLAKCTGAKFKWQCTYEEPCEAPFDKCAPCRKAYDIKRKDGTIKPCAKGAASASPSAAPGS